MKEFKQEQNSLLYFATTVMVIKVGWKGNLLQLKKVFGKINAPNITQDPDYGIGKYTDGELYRLLRTGIKKDGKLAVPMMMRFPTAADEEIYSMIAYLRSDRKAVQPSQKEIAPYEPTFLVKLLSKMVFEPFPLPKGEIKRPNPNDPTYGFYLANSVYACYDCHSGAFQTNNFMEPEKSPGFMAGGIPISVGEMEAVKASNITMHKEAGIGSWTADEFLTALKFGRKPDGSMLKYPMLPYNFLDTVEIRAIFDYINTVPVQSGNVVAQLAK